MAFYRDVSNKHNEICRKLSRVQENLLETIRKQMIQGICRLNLRIEINRKSVILVKNRVMASESAILDFNGETKTEKRLDFLVSNRCQNMTQNNQFHVLACKK